MTYRFLADLVVVAHFAFILTAALGAVLVFKWKWFVWVHLPVVLWAALIEFTGWICPLTPLENALRLRGGAAGYSTSFIEHYLLPLIYPASLTRGLQITLGLLVLGGNAALYGWLLRRRLHAPRPTGRIGT